jgi:hypothetical protein
MVQSSATRIIVEQAAGGTHWTAWFADDPRGSKGGQTTRLALRNLLAAHPGRIPARYVLQMDRSRYQPGHFEIVVQTEGESAVCPECNGRGQYVGLNVVEPCAACGGTGRLG